MREEGGWRSSSLEAEGRERPQLYPLLPLRKPTELTRSIPTGRLMSHNTQKLYKSSPDSGPELRGVLIPLDLMSKLFSLTLTPLPSG